jgi:hypothetical protein
MPGSDISDSVSFSHSQSLRGSYWSFFTIKEDVALFVVQNTIDLTSTVGNSDGVGAHVFSIIKLLFLSSLPTSKQRFICASLLKVNINIHFTFAIRI